MHGSSAYSTVYDDVTLCMMMWHSAWWCDTVYDDVTLCVWWCDTVCWCDTVYDDVTLCMMMWNCVQCDMCMVMWRCVWWCDTCHVQHKTLRPLARIQTSPLSLPPCGEQTIFFVLLLSKNIFHILHAIHLIMDAKKKQVTWQKNKKKMKSPDYGGVVARVHLRVALQWAPGFRAWGPRKRASTMSRTCDYMYVCMYVQACSPGVFPGRVPSHPVDGEPFTFQKRPYWTQGLEFNLRHFSRERTH